MVRLVAVKLQEKNDVNTLFSVQKGCFLTRESCRWVIV